MEGAFIHFEECRTEICFLGTVREIQGAAIRSYDSRTFWVIVIILVIIIRKSNELMQIYIQLIWLKNSVDCLYYDRKLISGL